VRDRLHDCVPDGAPVSKLSMGSSGRCSGLQKAVEQEVRTVDSGKHHTRKLLVRPENLTAPLSNRENTRLVENIICVVPGR
jgi:hypothetical protein